jgi:hypothetical protein
VEAVCGDLDLKKLRSALKHPILIDGRNLYRPEEMARTGFVYHSIGRPVAIPDGMAFESTADAIHRERNSRSNPAVRWRPGSGTSISRANVPL